MKLIEAWRLTQSEELFSVEDPTDFLVNEFPRLSAYYQNVRRYGDTALAEYMALEGLGLDDIVVNIAAPDPEAEDEPPPELDEEYLAALDQAITRIINFYQHQKVQSWYVTGDHYELIGQKYSPIDKVAVLMPRRWKFAPLTLMMSIIPAIIAGVKDLYINLPPTGSSDGRDDISPFVTWICTKLGISQIFRLPEVPAVFGFAVGTDLVPRVDKLVGAGSPEVQAAAALVSTAVGTKILSDRNETAVIADGSANETFLVADVFAAAEDPSLHHVTILTNSMVKATEITAEINRRLKESDEAKRLKEILSVRGAIVLTKDLNEALSIIERYPPKHLSLFVKRPLDLLGRIRDAGVLYLGDYSPAGMENYFASASNLIPSGRSCRYQSPLDVYDFLKKASVVHYTREQVEHVFKMIKSLADRDNLPFHRESFRVRMMDKSLRE